MRMTQITTLSFFKFKTLGSKLWALSMMQLAHSGLAKIKGQSFYKLMGSGRGLGFNAFPDWSTYVLWQVWEKEELAQDFFQRSPLYKDYKKRTTEIWTVYLKNSSAHGQWSGRTPFQISEELPENNNVIVLTRATIKWHKLISFWKYVPISHQPLKNSNGLIYTKGVGELPLFKMATLSIWRDEASLKEFVYQSKEHKEAISKTKKLKWYKEELFARFKPYKSDGYWEGVTPISFE
jgi:quinol monooxygenase YgiN